jgi:4-amino-4-deoxy-L-arabinose transferase-like glycosyltransferase
LKGILARITSGTGVFLSLFTLALALRIANAAWGSLKLDDFHSLHHARAHDLGTFFTVLQQDNHPPLSFLLVRATRAVLGEGTWALRLPSLLAGLGTLALVWRLGARLACPLARGSAALLLAASTLHIEISSDVRMYALLSLASAGLLEGLLARFEDGRGQWRIALWTAVGLHTHYHFLYMLAALGSTSMLLGITRSTYRRASWSCLGAIALGCLASAPWYVLGFPAQLRHGLAPGSTNAAFGRLFEGLKNLVFLNVSAAGPELRWVGLVASGAMLVLALLGAVGLLRQSRTTARPAPAWLLLAAAFLAPTLAWAVAQFRPRAGFDWRYLAGTIPAFCLVVGAEACAIGALARVRRSAVLAVGACALLIALPNVRDPGGEDYRGAIEWILARASAEDAVVVADWQPLIFPHALAWEYYAPRLAHGRPLPRRLDYSGDLTLVSPGELDRYQRVFCCLRNWRIKFGILAALRERFPHEEIQAFGYSVYAHEFSLP